MTALKIIHAFEDEADPASDPPSGIADIPLWNCFLNNENHWEWIHVHLVMLFVCIPQPQEQKSLRRQTQCSRTLCGCLCTWHIWCCPLQPFQMRYFAVHSDRKSCCCFCAFLISKMNFIWRPQGQESCRRQTQCSSKLCGYLCTRPIWCCPL